MSLSNQKILSMKKIKGEYKDLEKNPLANIGLSIGLPDRDNIFEWTCTFIGPKDTPYKDGLFIVKVKFPENYPNEKPEVCFETPIYHVNINPMKSDQALGHVCISTLNWWDPKYSMKEVLNNIYALFYRGNPDSPYGINRAEELRNNKDLYDEKVRFFTQKYASMSRNPDKDPKYEYKWDFTYSK